MPEGAADGLKFSSGPRFSAGWRFRAFINFEETLRHKNNSQDLMNENQVLQMHSRDSLSKCFAARKCIKNREEGTSNQSELASTMRPSS